MTTERIEIKHLIAACAEHAGVEPDVIAHDRIPALTSPYRQLVCYLAIAHHDHSDIAAALNSGEPEIEGAIGIMHGHSDERRVVAFDLTGVGVRPRLLPNPMEADTSRATKPFATWAAQIRRRAAEMQAADQQETA